MIELNLERDRRARSRSSTKVVQGFAQAIEAQSLRAGALLPSVRQLPAQTHELSTFTVTERTTVWCRWGCRGRAARLRLSRGGALRLRRERP